VAETGGAADARRVLLVDDDDGDAALVEALLAELEGSEYRFDWIDSYESGLAAMAASRHDVYLVDHDLGARTGIELLEEAASRGCSGPRILLTGNRNPELDRQALAAGAIDFLVKQTLSAETLDRTLRFALERDRLMRALRDQTSQMAGGIAHDFNNMLMGVVGSLDLATADPSCTRSVRTHMARARASAERASELSRRLLAYARRRHVEAGVVDVCAVVREVEPALGRRVADVARLTVELPAESLHVGIGEGELEEILVNLVANAANAMERPGSIRVEVASRADLRRGRHGGNSELVRISVHDDGRGMSSDVAARIFEPFFTTRLGCGGTGLGLAMVHDIVTSREGRIELESRPGQGTRFDLLLPRVAAPERTRRPVRGGLPSELGVVLLVDDELHIREILQLALSAAGATVVAAGDAETALARLERGSVEPELLITDVTMPGMNGFELQDELRRRGWDLPTLFVTGYGSDALEERELDPARERLLDKPFRLEELFAQLRSLST